VKQTLERYGPLVGHQKPPPSSWFDFRPVDDRQAHLASIGGDLEGDDHKYFFAINLYNSFDIIPDLFATLFRVSAILGYHNVYVSIYENGSTDQTKALLRIFDALTRTVGLRVRIHTSQRTRGAFNHRIEYLAEVRNAAFGPLHELREGGNEYFDTIVFMNDVLPCVDDLLELIWQSRRNNAGITCAADYMYHEEIVSRSLSFSMRSLQTFPSGISCILRQLGSQGYQRDSSRERSVPSHLSSPSVQRALPEAPTCTGVWSHV
jgi:alpha-1,3-mannosyltransferase